MALRRQYHVRSAAELEEAKRLRETHERTAEAAAAEKRTQAKAKAAIAKSGCQVSFVSGVSAARLVSAA